MVILNILYKNWKIKSYAHKIIMHFVYLVITFTNVFYFWENAFLTFFYLFPNVYDIYVV